MPERPTPRRALVLCLPLLLALPAAAGPPEHAGGPYARLILRGVTVVDGTGAPPRGPFDVVVEGERIAALVKVGTPGLPIDPARRPAAAPGDRVLDLDGAWLLPGFVDLWAHPGPEPGYAWKLWLAHGVTTAREPVCLGGMAACLEQAARSERGEVAAPRLVPWLYFGTGETGGAETFATPDDARRWVARAAAQGAAGIRLRALPPEVFAAALAEAERLGLSTSGSFYPPQVARTDSLDAARLGLDLQEHWYGVPESLLPDGALQDFPVDFNFDDETARFAVAGRLWRQAPPRGDPRRTAVVAEMVERGLAMVPTLALYEANRDLMRAWRAEWHDDYTLPSLWDSFRPDPRRHATHFHAWSGEHEATWRDNYRRWQDFLAEYRAAGGRVLVGTDAGFQYLLHGFGYVRELELLREAGLLPLEVVRAATSWGAEALGLGEETGSIEVGKRADLVVVAENPLADLKVLYGTGVLRWVEGGGAGEGRLVRVGGVDWVVKGGRVYSGGVLRAEVRGMVAAAKAEDGWRGLPKLEE